MRDILPLLLGGYALLITGALLTLAVGHRKRRKGGDKEGAGKTTNLVLLVLGSFLLAFIVTMTVIYCVKGSVPDTLIQYTLGGGGLEVLLCAGIKISKVVTGDKPGESEE